MELPLTNEMQTVLKYDGATVVKHRSCFKGMSGSSTYEGNYKNYEYKQKAKPETKKSKKVEATKTISSIHKINKSKLKAKIYAFFKLKQSIKFCAFYSVSFPLGMPDVSALTVLNNVLTSLRQSSLKFNYIWVAERQKNGTIHFHILMNMFKNIRIVNHYFARAISNELNVSNLHNLKYNPSEYNGCDVKRVNDEKGIKNYITKYITKNDEIFKCRAWASDQKVSRLFTSISYHYGEVYLHEAHFFYNNLDKIISFGDDFFNYYPLKKPPPRNLMEPLIVANNLINNDYEKNGNNADSITLVALDSTNKNEQVIQGILNFGVL